jgi:DNA-binding transcriptional ArsR family regulator
MPSIDVFQAIADPSRRAILASLATGEREQAVAHLKAVLPEVMTFSAVSQHLKVLRDADLVTVRKAGRERLYRLNPEPLRSIAEWARTYERFWTEHLDKLGDLLESETE